MYKQGDGMEIKLGQVKRKFYEKNKVGEAKS